MKKPTIIFIGVLFGACSLRHADSDDASGADSSASGDSGTEGVVGDPWNCGEVGAKCVGPMGIGECVDGFLASRHSA